MAAPLHGWSFTIPAWLLFVLFVGDRDIGGPATVEEWAGAIKVMKLLLGVGERHALTRYVIDVYVDVDEIEGH